MGGPFSIWEGSWEGNMVEVKELSICDRIAIGGFADIFSPPPGTLVIKVFRRLEDPCFGDVAPFIMASEMAAYELACADPVLRGHVPAFAGACTVGAVYAHDGENISSRYWLNNCYAIERLSPDPDERKLGSFFNEPEWHIVESLEKAFATIGISHVGDASVFYWRTGTPVLVDFATYDAAATHARIDQTKSIPRSNESNSE
jgi:hypothetical protein